MQNAAQPFLSSFFPDTYQPENIFPRRNSSTGHSSVKEQTFFLTAVEEKLLLALYRFHYLTIDQIVSYLGLSSNSTNWIRKKLRSLLDREFVDTQFLPRMTPYGRLPLIYMLGTEGINHFKELGYSVSYHSPKERIRSFLFLTHTLELNNLLIAACALSRVVPEITLTGFKHERVLKHMPCKVDVGNGKKSSVVPDGWLDWQLEKPFGAPGSDRFSVFVELDRDTEDISQYKPKIRAYLAFADGAYTAFGSESFNVVFLVAEGADRRLQQLRKWTLEELTAQKAVQYCVFFKFALLPRSPIDPVSLFLAPHWFSLEDDRQASLIEKIL
jgi:hypothetical protein